MAVRYSGAMSSAWARFTPAKGNTRNEARTPVRIEHLMMEAPQEDERICPARYHYLYTPTALKQRGVLHKSLAGNKSEERGRIKQGRRLRRLLLTLINR